MSDFSRKFLLEDARRLNSDSPSQIHLGGFGKHPGWDDHIEDIGLDTESLVIAKQLLYVEGIGRQIDAGSWEKLEDGQQLPFFDHVFVWERSAQYLIGKMWSSTDGKGRTRYPMIACAHCIALPFSWAVQNVIPRLDEVHKSCMATKSAAEVRSVFSRVLKDLRALIKPAKIPVGEFSLKDVEAFLACPEFEAQHEGLLRILHQMHSQMSGYLVSQPSAKSGTSLNLDLRPKQIRVPACSNSPGQAILLWQWFFSSQFAPSTPIFLTAALQQPWLDVIVGEPSTQEFFCLKASRKAMPLASEVPYNLDSDFRQEADKVIASLWRNGGPTDYGQAKGPADSSAARLKPALSSAQRDSGVFKLKLKRFLGLFALFLLLALILGYGFVFLRAHKFPEKSRIAPGAGQTGQLPRANVTADEQGKQTIDAEHSVPETEQQKQAATPAEQPRQNELPKLTDKKTTKPATEDDLSERQGAAPLVAKQPPEETGKPIEKQADQGEPAQLLTKVHEAQRQGVLPVGETRQGEATLRVLEDNSRREDRGKYMTNSVGMMLVWVLGMPGTKAGCWVGQYEVTQGEYEKAMSVNPSAFKGPRHPVEMVSWTDAVEFCRKLTAIEKSEGKLPEGAVYTLPTEIQWTHLLGEANFKDGVTSRNGTLRGSTETVGSVKVANQCGLYDVVGNVWEWCLDSPDTERVLRGGAYDSGPSLNFKSLTETTSWEAPPDTRKKNVGFRCVMITQQENSPQENK